MQQVESYLAVKPWADDQYVLSGTLGFINEDVLIRVWGPATVDEMLEHAEKQGHRPHTHFERASITPDSVVAYCAPCDSYVSSAQGSRFFGRMLEVPCSKKAATVSCPAYHR